MTPWAGMSSLVRRGVHVCLPTSKTDFFVVVVVVVCALFFLSCMVKENTDGTRTCSSGPGKNLSSEERGTPLDDPDEVIGRRLIRSPI